MSTSEIIIQAIGLVSSAIFIFSYQIRSPKKLILAQLVASLVVSVHYWLLGQWTGCALNLVSALRAAVCSSDRPWTRSRWTLVGLMVVSVGAGILSWQGPISLLPIAGMISGAISVFSRNARIIRVVQMSFTSPVWLIYNIVARSIPGTITDSFNIISVIVSLIRFGWKGLADPDGEAARTASDAKAAVSRTAQTEGEQSPDAGQTESEK